MRVMVLGAGPAGLLAADAALLLGCEVTVVSAPEEGNPLEPAKSALHGCQYLHDHIPNVTNRWDKRRVRYTLEGSSESYRRKVYGDNWNGQVSPDEYGDEADHYAWNLRAAYDRMWERWSLDIIPRVLTPRSLPALLEEHSPHLVLATIPAPAVCVDMEHHQFVTQSIWALGQRDEPDSDLPISCPDDTVVCNGHEGTGWYRKARVFGHTTIEWPDGRKPPIEGVVRVNKPLRTDCQCWMTEGHYYRLGRYGQWKKGVLLHEVWHDTFSIIESAQDRGVQGTIWDPA